MTARPAGAARLPPWWGLVPLVLLVHLWLGSRVADLAVALNQAGGDADMRRLKADFIVELRPQRPDPPAPPIPAPVARRAPAPAPASPAGSASAPPQEEPVPESPATEDAPTRVADPVASPAEAGAPQALAAEAAVRAEVPPAGPVDAVAPAVPAASGPADGGQPAFEWPRSTRLTFQLTGNYRGPVNGSASVEWLYDAGRYQVHVEVAVGPSFAPLVSRRMSSDGTAGVDGLRPRLYEEETRTPFREPRRQRVRFDDDHLTLATGAVLPRPSGVQDTASQFVQLTWLFMTRPGLLQPGQTVELPLALPRRVDPWTYDVLPAETVYTNAGPIEAVPVRPRRLSKPSGELSAELWVAPSLQHLPVRIVIRQDEETYVDLLLDGLPRQASGTRPPG